MSRTLLSNIECPICLETYQPPIRMLPCGHNYCESCIINLPSTSRQEISCPKCRKLVQIRKESLSLLPRCHDLENLIENLKEVNIENKQGKIASNQTQNSFPILNRSGEALLQFRVNVTTLMDNDKQEQVMHALPTIINSEKGLEKVIRKINKAICQLESRQHYEAVVTCAKIVSLVESKVTTNEMDSIKDKVFDKLINLCEKFVEFNSIDSSFSLVSCLICLTKNLYKDQIQLIYFRRIGGLMERLAILMNKQNKQEKIKQFYCLFDKIFDNMTDVDNVDLRFKCKQLAWFFKYYGLCCIYGKEYSKSEIIHNNAIVLMKTVFGSEVEQHRVFGNCCNNLAVSFENSNQFSKAKIYYQQALNAYKQATDFEDDTKKQESVSLSSNNLQRIENELK